MKAASQLRRAARPRLTTIAAVLSVMLMAAFALPAVALFQEQPAVDQELTGIFTVAISRVDIPGGLAGGPALVGLWNLTLNGDGSYSLSRQDVGDVVSGTFEAGVATLSFSEWDGIVGCTIGAESGEPATYAWRKVDDNLTLTAIDDTCTERLILLTTRSLGGFEACAVSPRPLTDPFASMPLQEEIAATPVAGFTQGTGVAAQEGLTEGADAEEAIDDLLRQANGCWTTGDPARFLALHSDRVVQEIAFGGPLDLFARELRLFMATPVNFERIGPVNLTDPEHAWAYVEINLGGDPLPQRIDFVFENGAWLFDTFFLFGPPTPTGPVDVQA